MKLRLHALSGPRYAAVLLLTLGSPASALAAQSGGASPDPGVRMRIVNSAGTEVSGRLVSWRADSIILAVGGEERAFESQSLVRAETFAGRSSQAWRGAKLGLVVGAIAGVALGLASGDDESGWFAMSAGEKALGAGIGFGMLGMGIGAGVGAASHVDRWQAVTIPDAVPPVARSGTRIGARLAF